MATAAGTPVIGLYASSNPERTGPYNDMELTVNKYPEAVQKEFGKSVSEVRFGAACAQSAGNGSDHRCRRHGEGGDRAGKRDPTGALP